MLFFELFLFFISLQKIYLITDYCSSRIEPKEPNDCVFLSTKENKCCFNPKNKSQCFNTSGEGFICEAIEKNIKKRQIFKILPFFVGHLLDKAC